MAEKDEKAGPEPDDTGMGKRDMKVLLKRSQRDPVNCAMGRSKALGLLLMDKLRPPKALMQELKDKYSDIRTPVFGTASADGETKVVTFAVNKRVPGLDRRLRKTLKGTGYSKVAVQSGAAAGGEE